MDYPVNMINYNKAEDHHNFQLGNYIFHFGFFAKIVIKLL